MNLANPIYNCIEVDFNMLVYSGNQLGIPINTIIKGLIMEIRVNRSIDPPSLPLFTYDLQQKSVLLANVSTLCETNFIKRHNVTNIKSWRSHNTFNPPKLTKIKILVSEKLN